jgi:NTE family protein
VATSLAKWSVSPDAYAAWSARRLAPPATDLAAVDEIRFTPMANVNPDIARSTMQTHPGETIVPQELDRDMRRLYGMGDFEHVNYSLLEEPGRRILSVDAVEKSWGPYYLRLGLGLSTDFRGDAFFNLLASYRMTWLNSLGAEWRSNLQIGHTSRIDTEFYQPLEPSRTFFAAPTLGYERRTVDVYQTDQRVASYDLRDSFAGIDLGAQFTRYGEVRLGFGYTRTTVKLDTGSPEFLPDPVSSTDSVVRLRAAVDQLDSVTFPRAGYAAELQLLAARASLGGDADYTRAEAAVTYAVSLGEHTFNLAAKYGSRIGSDVLPPTHYFQWGGLLQQSGYPTGALIGEELQFMRATYYHRLARWSLLDGLYGGLSLEAGRVGKPLVPGNEQGTLYSGALVLGLDTPLGPLYLGYGRANHGYDSLYLFLGRP